MSAYMARARAAAERINKSFGLDLNEEALQIVTRIVEHNCFPRHAEGEGGATHVFGTPRKA